MDTTQIEAALTEARENDFYITIELADLGESFMTSAQAQKAYEIWSENPIEDGFEVIEVHRDPELNKLNETAAALQFALATSRLVTVELDEGEIELSAQEAWDTWKETSPGEGFEVISLSKY